MSATVYYSSSTNKQRWPSFHSLVEILPFRLFSLKNQRQSKMSISKKVLLPMFRKLPTNLIVWYSIHGSAAPSTSFTMLFHNRVIFIHTFILFWLQHSVYRAGFWCNDIMMSTLLSVYVNKWSIRKLLHTWWWWWWWWYIERNCSRSFANSEYGIKADPID